MNTHQKFKNIKISRASFQTMYFLWLWLNHEMLTNVISCQENK